MSTFSSNSQNLLISKSSAPLYVKFALFSLNKASFPRWLGYLSFILAHLQVLALIIKSIYLTLPDNTPSSSPAIRLFVNIFVLGDWLSPKNTAPLFIGTLIITGYTVKILGLMLYIHLALAFRRKIPSLVQNYWTILHTVHPLVFFFWIHTFSLEIIKYSRENDFFRPIEVFMTAMAYFNAAASCALAVFFSVISVMYKTKDVISSKINILETKAVIFKIIVPILWVNAGDNKGVQVLGIVLPLVNALLHDYLLIKYLPYYRVNVLLLSALLQAAQTSLAIVSCIVKIIEGAKVKHDIGVFSVQIIWLLVVPFVMRGYHLFVWRMILQVYQCEIKDEKNVYYLIHKRFILLYFLKTRKIINEGVKKLELADLLYQGKLNQAIEDSGLNFAEVDKSRKLLVKSQKIFCINILTKYPKSAIAQVNLASLYSKFDDLYLLSNNLIEEGTAKSPGYHAQISLNMIRFELQTKFSLQFSQQNRSDEGEGLDISNYIINQDLYQQVKDNMEKQAHMQHDFWKEFLSSKSNMLNLMNIALKVRNQKKIIKRLWHNLLKTRPSTFLSPLIIYGTYSSLINNDPIEGEKCMEQSQEDAKRLRRYFRMDELNNHTIFSDKTVKLIMSGMKSKLGRILDCSSNVAYSYGWQSGHLKGKPIESLMPPFYRTRHDKYLQTHFQTGRMKILNKTAIFPVKSSDGYIRPTWIHAKVNPVMDQGISYVALLRPCRSNQRMLVVRKDGKIDDMSLEFAQDMNLVGKEDQIEADMFMLCPEFQLVNNAFNLIAEGGEDATTLQVSSPSLMVKSFDAVKPTSAFDINTPMHKSNILMEGDVHSIYESFTKGSVLTFSPLVAPNDFVTAAESEQYLYYNTKPVAYTVKITNKIHEKEIIKYVMLERISQEDSDDSDKEGDTSPSLRMATRKDTKKKTTAKFVPAEIAKEDLASPLVSPQPTTGKALLNPLSVRDYTMDGSIFDEIQSVDSAARKMVFRSIGDEVQNRSRNLMTTEETAVKTTLQRGVSTTTNEVLLAPREQQEPMMFSQNQFLNLLKKRRKDVAKNTLLMSPSKKKRESTILNQDGEENKLFKAKMKERLEKVIMNVENKAESVASTYLSKGKKAQQLVTQALKTTPKKRSAKLFTYNFAVFIVAMIVLLVVQNVNLEMGISQVEGQMPVITTAFLRQNAMISSATGLRAWNGVLKMAFSSGNWAADNLRWQVYTTPYAKKLKDYNAEFYQLLNKISTEAQGRLYAKDVAMYDFNSKDNTKTLVNTISTMEAFQVLIEKEYSCLGTETPVPFSPNIDTSSFDYVLYNALNDLLIRSQSQIDQLTLDLWDSTDSTVRKTAFVLITVLVISILFFAATVRYLYIMAKEANVFMVMIFRLKPTDCEAVQAIIHRFRSALNGDITDLVLSEEAEKLKEEKTRVNNSQNNQAKFRIAKLNSLYLRQRLAFLKLLPNFLLFICWSIIYYFVTSNFIDNIKSSEKQMETALQALSNQSLFVTELIAVPLTNSTAIIRNQEVLPDFLTNLKTLQQTTLLVDNFRDKNGDLTALQESVLFNFPCEDLLTIYDGDYADDYVYCVDLAKETNSIGLVNVNSQLYAAGTYAYELFAASSRTRTELAIIFFTGLTMCTSMINAAEGFLNILYRSTNDSFAEEVDSVKGGIVILMLAVLFVTIVGTLMTWYLAIKKIFKLQKMDWFVLQVIPIKLILGNKYLQQYLMKHSGGMLNSVKNFLN